MRDRSALVPTRTVSWMKSGLSIIPVGGRVLFTLWPLEIRASSGREHAEIFDALSGIGKVEELGRVDYDLPPFEKMTLSESRLSPPKRKGLLLRLTKSTEKQLEVSPFSRARSEWHRFTISGEQVAIKVDLDFKDCDHDWSFKVDPFVLRSTSRRDPVLSTINIWTSRNVVARLANPSSVARGIAEHQQIHLRMLAEKMNMEFDPDNIRWGMSWQHPA